MAVIKDPRTQQSYGRSLSKKISSLNSRMDELYSTTYASRPDNKRDMDRIVGDIDASLDNIIGAKAAANVSDITNLYLRLQKKQGYTSGDILEKTFDLFSDNSLINSLSMNPELMRCIQAENYQIDMICKYMPKLEDTIEIKKDNTLSSDNFTKDFINIKSDKYTEDSNAYFYQRAKAVRDKYKVQDLFDKMCYQADKYGEVFVYNVPYRTAIQRLLQRQTRRSIRTEATATVDHVIFESSKIDSIDELDKPVKEAIGKMIKSNNVKVNLTFNHFNCLESVITSYGTANTVLEVCKETSLNESYTAISEDADTVTQTTSVYSKKETNRSKIGNISADGLITPSTNKRSEEKIKETVNGAVVTIIPRDQILPIYIDTICIGYYYLTVSNLDLCPKCGNGASIANGMSHAFTSGMYDDNNVDALLSYVAAQMSTAIDAQFVNANVDLKEEIYAILKYNDKFSVLNGTNNINVTFLPVEDVEHFYFDFDDKTHRGVSSLRKAIVPAMMYVMLQLTNTIAQVTRAADKRIYYVKQNVETNVARTLLNVVNQIKKGNMGMRQISSMDSILSVVGRYNDHVIPVGQSGDAPIQFEVMQGQQIETPTELMERFEDSAISSTDVPLEFVQSVNQVDYATRFTMSNSKFLRKIYKRQRICQDSFSRIFTKIYNYEYGENEELIKILLPAPAFLSMTNTQQLLNNIRDFVNAVADIEMAGAEDEARQMFVRKMMRSYLGSYLDYDQIDNFKEQVNIEMEIRKTENSDDDSM